MNATKDGYYWVNMGDSALQVALYEDGGWYICGNESHYVDDEWYVTVVSGPLEPPK
jgi:hypothetical protein